jgi:hypothetical protein
MSIADKIIPSSIGSAGTEPTEKQPISIIVEEKKFLEFNELTINWLQQFKVQKGEISTHTLISGGSFNIPEEHLPRLFKLLAHDETPLSLTESHVPNHSPIIVDYDFRFHSKPQQRVVDNVLIKQCVQLYHTHLIEMGISDEDLLLTFALTRKEGYYDGNIYKDGFHLHFPLLVIDYESQYELRRRVIQDLKNLTNFPQTTNSIEDVVDYAVIKRNNWLLLGCQKPDRAPYHIRMIYLNYNREVIGHRFKQSVLKDYTNQQLIELLSIRYINDRPITKTNYEPIGQIAEKTCNPLSNNKNHDVLNGVYYIEENYSRQRTVKKDDSLSSMNSPYIISLFQTHHPDSVLVGIKSLSESGKLIMYEFSKSSHECLICHRVHKHNRQYVIENLGSHRIIYKCHDSDAENKLLYLLPNPTQLIEPNELINEEQIPQYDWHDRKCLICESGVGTGKTVRMVDMIAHLSTETRIVVITYRRSLSKKYHEDLKGLGFVNYLDIKQHQINQPRVIIQLDSLYRLNAGDLDWQLVIIDEIDSVLGQFASHLMKHKHDNAEVFEYLINQSQQTLFLDANINTPRVCDFVHSMYDREEVYYLKNKWVRQSNRVIHLVKEQPGLINQYLQSLKDGYNVVMISTSKEFLKKIEKMTSPIISADQMLFYTSENNHMNTDTDVNNLWIQKRVVGYTPAISSGISFNMSHFDQVFIYCGAGSCDYLTLFQMMFRVRQLRKGQMYMYINPQRNNYPAKPEIIEKLIEDEYNEMYYEMGENFIYRKIGRNHKYYYPIKDWSYRLYINNLIVHFKSENNFAYGIIRMLSRLYIPFIHEDGPDNNIKCRTRLLLKEAKQQVDSDRKEIINIAPVITEQEYTQLKQLSEHSDLSQLDRVTMLKHYCCQIYQVESQDLLPQYVDPVKLHQYINRAKMNHVDIQLRISQVVGSGLQQAGQINDVFSYFDEKHEYFDLLLCYTFLCTVLGLVNLTQNEILNYSVDGAQLFSRWSQHIENIANKIEVWTFKLREDRTKMITKNRCQQWTNKEFIAFLNSLISHKLGLHLCISNRNGHNKMKNIYRLRDDFEGMTIREIDLGKSMFPKGLLWGNYVPPDPPPTPRVFR